MELTGVSFLLRVPGSRRRPIDTPFGRLLLVHARLLSEDNSVEVFATGVPMDN